MSVTQFVAPTYFANAAGQSAGALPGVGAAALQSNGANGWDAVFNNQQGTILTATGRTTSFTSANILNYNWRFFMVFLNTTAIGTGSITVTVNAIDAASGVVFGLGSGAAVTTNTMNAYSYGPGLPATANVSFNVIVPRTLQVVVTANNANAATYTVGYAFGV